MPFFGDGLHGMLQNPVNAVFDGDFGIARFDVDVTGAALERGENNRFNEADHRAGGAVAREPVPRNRFFALFLFLGGLESECFRGLLKNALRLLGAFQQVTNLACRCDADCELLAEEQRQLIAHLHAGIGYGNRQDVVLHFQRHEVVAEHQVRGDGSEQFRIDALLLEINKTKAIPLGEFAREIAFVLLVTAGQSRRRRKLFCRSHEPYLGAPVMEKEKIGKYSEIRIKATNNPMKIRRTGSMMDTSADNRKLTSSS